LRLVHRLRLLGTLFALATVIYAIKTKQSHGRFAGVPFEFRTPTLQRVKERWWNPNDRRLLTPHVFGIGWSINIPQVLKWLRLRD
jgi:uncharacterized membrane protein